MGRLCVFCIYFVYHIPGQRSFGDWFRHVLKSYALNPRVDFYVVTNVDVPPEFSEIARNTTFVKSDTEPYNRFIRDVLGIDDYSRPGYRCFGSHDACGLKPFTPLIFDSITKDYQYFGWIDYDCVLDENFFECESGILSQLDAGAFSTYKFVCTGGPFTCHRNVARYDEYYTEQIPLAVKFYNDNVKITPTQTNRAKSFRIFDDGTMRMNWLHDFMEKRNLGIVNGGAYRLVIYHMPGFYRDVTGVHPPKIINPGGRKTFFLYDSIVKFNPAGLLDILRSEYKGGFY